MGVVVYDMGDFQSDFVLQLFILSKALESLPPRVIFSVPGLWRTANPDRKHQMDGVVVLWVGSGVSICGCLSLSLSPMLCPPVFTLQSLPSSLKITIREHMIDCPDNTNTYDQGCHNAGDADTRSLFRSGQICSIDVHTVNFGSQRPFVH